MDVLSSPRSHHMDVLSSPRSHHMDAEALNETPAEGAGHRVAGVQLHKLIGTVDADLVVAGLGREEVSSVVKADAAGGVVPKAGEGGRETNGHSQRSGIHLGDACWEGGQPVNRRYLRLLE